VLKTGGVVGLLDSELGTGSIGGREDSLPDRIGPYRVLGLLGEGGMGIVFRVEQTHPVKRELALKLVKTGLDPGQLVARFEAERQALALMDHPHIAKVHDSGADRSGRLYFVMELVRGVPINDYCESKGLDLRDRVKLFLTVCRAVQHAHQKGIIHRDLKPSNVLVTMHDGQPFPMIIDFGVAKVTSASADQLPQMTRVGQILGTPDYMSPEQMSGDPGGFDVQSDVYSLGVILYQLLSGRLPYDTRKSSLLEIAKVIKDEDPLPLMKHDATSERVDKDLITIVGKSLEKEPQRRYHSAASLAEELKRYLASQPILAHPPSTMYQLRKMVSRHRLAMSFAATVFVLLIGFALTMSVLYRGQSRARARAEQQTRKAERINEFLQAMLATENPLDKGQDMTVRELVDSAAANIDSTLVGEPEVEAAVRQTLGETYTLLDLFEESEEQLNTARDIRRGLLGDRHPEVAEVMLKQAVLLEKQSRYAQAESLSREAISIYEEQEEYADEELSCREVLGSVLMSQSRMDEAETVLSRAATDRRLLSGTYHRRTASTFNTLAQLYYFTSRYAEAESLIAICRDIYLRLGPRDKVAENTDNLGVLAHTLGKYEEAITLANEAIAIYTDLYGENHTRTIHCMANLGVALQSQGNFAAAEEVNRQVLDRRLEILDEDHIAIFNARSTLANILMWRGKLVEAERMADDLYPDVVRRFGEEHMLHGLWFARRAGIFRQQKRYAEADSCFARASAIYHMVFGENHLLIGWALRGRANVAMDLGEMLLAEQFCDQSLTMLSGLLGEEDPGVISTRLNLADIRLRQGRAVEVEAEIRRCLVGLRERYGRTHWESAIAGFILGKCAAEQGRQEEAEALIDESLPVLAELDRTPAWIWSGSLAQGANLYDSWNRPDQAEKYRHILARGPD
jgi:serine/threonine protein kinase